MLTIHGRTRSERYDVPVDYRSVARGGLRAREIGTGSIVTTGNGDIMDDRGAQKMVERTRCDAVMISGGALGNP